MYGETRINEIINSMKKATKEILKSKESAKAFLDKTGIYTKDGKLTKEYGGNA